MINLDKKVSLAVVKRLPRYYRFLADLLDNGIKRISSKELSERMNLTASQIRQDFNNFGCFGQQGYGYNVEVLYKEIKEILGLNKTYNIVIIGFGNLGQALSNYPNFKKRGFNFIAAFDINKSIIGKNINNIPVLDIKDLEQFLKQNIVDIAALTLPRNKTLDVLNIILKTSIKSIWNFSNIELKTPKDIAVENVHLTDSLMMLAFKSNSKYKIFYD